MRACPSSIFELHNDFRFRAPLNQPTIELFQSSNSKVYAHKVDDNGYRGNKL